MAKSGIKNLKAFQKKLKKRVVDNPTEHLGNLVLRSAAIVTETAQDSIRSGGKTGRAYSRGGKVHIASAEGEAPAKDSGNLATGITFKVVEEKNAIIGRVQSNSFGLSDYGIHLEFGTSKMRPRPFMQPALEKNRPRIKRIFREGGYVD
jgi:HK97 gp10 family phage protein